LLWFIGQISTVTPRVQLTFPLPPFFLHLSSSSVLGIQKHQHHWAVLVKRISGKWVDSLTTLLSSPSEIGSSVSMNDNRTCLSWNKFSRATLLIAYHWRTSKSSRFPQVSR
jgi:hypothetical protein